MKKIFDFCIILMLVFSIMLAFATVTQAASETDLASETDTASTTDKSPLITKDDIVVPDGMNEEAASLWTRFWSAVIDMINGQNAREAIVTICSILGAVVALLLKSIVSSLATKIGSFTSNNGSKTNELINGVNENASEIAKLAEKIADVENATNGVAKTEEEKNAKIDTTADAILALADMLMTTYNCSSTIPAAAKEVIREKYVAVVKAANKGETTETTEE